MHGANIKLVSLVLLRRPGCPCIYFYDIDAEQVMASTL
jgi:hypothetical protein